VVRGARRRPLYGSSAGSGNGEKTTINRSTFIGGTLTGDYSTNHVNFVNFTIVKRF
jgi:hypothetical protein